jgi:hypothetical protein
MVSFTPKPPRSFSSTGISMTDGDSPAVIARRSTVRPSRSISSASRWPGIPDATSRRAVPPTGTERLSASRRAGSASGVRRPATTKSFGISKAAPNSSSVR